MLYQFSGRGAQHTRLGDRLQGGIALSHRFGAPPHNPAKPHNHHHGDELDEQHEGPRHSTWDAFVELAGEWEGRQKAGGEIEAESGGKWAYRAGAAFHRGVAVVGDRSRCVAGVAADPRLASRQPLPVHAVTGPRLLKSREG